MLLQPPDAVVADHHHDRQAVPHQRVDVHQREAGGAVAEQQHDLRGRAGQPGGDRVAEARCPGSRTGPGRASRRAAPARRTARRTRRSRRRRRSPPRPSASRGQQLAVDPGRVDRVAVAGRAARASPATAAAAVSPQPRQPVGVRRAAQQLLPGRRAARPAPASGRRRRARRAPACVASWPAESARCTTLAAGAPSGLPPNAP